MWYTLGGFTTPDILGPIMNLQAKLQVSGEIIFELSISILKDRHFASTIHLVACAL